MGRRGLTELYTVQWQIYKHYAHVWNIQMVVGRLRWLQTILSKLDDMTMNVSMRFDLRNSHGKSDLPCEYLFGVNVASRAFLISLAHQNEMTILYVIILLGIPMLCTPLYKFIFA